MLWNLPDIPMFDPKALMTMMLFILQLPDVRISFPAVDGSIITNKYRIITFLILESFNKEGDPKTQYTELSHSGH